MANSDATNKVKAGDAFHRIGDILASDPEAQKSWEKTRVEMQGFLAWLQTDAGRAAIRNAKQAERAKLATRHLPYPETYDQWKHLARIVELSEKEFDDLTPRHITDHALAYSDREKMRAALRAEAEARVRSGQEQDAEHGQDGGTGTGTVLTLDGPSIDVERVTYSVDLRSVNWYGTTYFFTATQAACIKVLLEHYKNKVSDVGEQTILTTVDSAQTRLATVFNNGKHPAWGTMIQHGSTKGTVRLVKPDG